MKVSQFIRCSGCNNLIGSSKNPPDLNKSGLCDKCYDNFKKSLTSVTKKAMTLQEAKEQTQKYIAQWVIDNRYQKNENKIGDHEMFHTIIDTTSSLLESCAKEARNNAIDECINMIGKLTDDEIITELLSLKDELLNLKEKK